MASEKKSSAETASSDAPDDDADDDEPDWVKSHQESSLRNEAIAELDRMQEVKRRHLERMRILSELPDGSNLNWRMQPKKPKIADKSDAEFDAIEELLPAEYDDEKDELKYEEEEDEIEEDTRIFYCSRTFVKEFLKTPYSENTRVLSLGSRKNLCINEKNSVKDIEDLVVLGKKTCICPYYGARNAIGSSELVTVPYNIILQKSSRESYKIKLKNSIVVFDEAHNLIDAIANAYNVSISLIELKKAGICLSAYINKFRNYFKGLNFAYLQQLENFLKALISHLQDSNVKSSRFHTTTDFLHRLETDNINLFKLVEYMEKSKVAYKIQSFGDKVTSQMKKKDGAVKEKTPPTLKELEKLMVLLLNPNVNGKVGVINQDGITSVRYILLSPLDVFQEIVTESRSVILAGGTMEPIGDFIDQLLSFLPKEKLHRFSCGHIVPATSVLTSVVPFSPTGSRLNFTFEARADPTMMKSLIHTLKEICTVVPKGVVCFVASYSFLDVVVKVLKSECVSENLGGKRIFAEPRPASDVSEILTKYSEAITNPELSGAVLFSVVGGKLSEGINFSDDLARAKYCTSGELLENLCMRALNQAIGRAIRHKDDYAAIYLMDNRFLSPNIKGKLPTWIRSSGVKIPNRFDEITNESKQFFQRLRK
ncbi:ATP-dependent DNA helicase chl1 [Phlyctochytrium planicorne]|nr:ATP-dependent DNA helicase chl1 [Phlyctochytrium planicorne]